MKANLYEFNFQEGKGLSFYWNFFFSGRPQLSVTIVDVSPSTPQPSPLSGSLLETSFDTGNG